MGSLADAIDIVQGGRLIAGLVQTFGVGEEDIGIADDRNVLS